MKMKIKVTEKMKPGKITKSDEKKSHGKGGLKIEGGFKDYGMKKGGGK